MRGEIINLKDLAARAKGAAIALVFALLLTTAPFWNSPFLTSASAGGTLSYADSDCDLDLLSTEGDGTSGNPYQLSTSQQLWELASCGGSVATNPKHFKIIANIDASQASAGTPTASPIGRPDAGVNKFFANSVLDGQGFAISFSMQTNLTRAGLFNEVTNVTISNLVLRGSVTKTGNTSGDTSENVGGLVNKSSFGVALISISSYITVSGDSNVGGLVGISVGNLRMVDVVNHGRVLGSEDYIGGLVGYDAAGSNIQIQSSSNLGAVTGRNYVGGLLGLSRNGTTTFSSSVNAATVSATGGYVGGILGGLYSTATISMTSVVNTGAISASAASNGRAGGIVGSSDGALSLVSVSNQGFVAGADYTGGLVGYSLGAVSLVSVSNQAIIGGDVRIGGLVGYHNGTSLEISASQNIGAVTGTGDEVGGLVGSHEGAGMATYSTVANMGDVLGSQYVGGLVGSIDLDATFVNSENHGTVSATSDYAGGIVGFATNDRDFRFESVSNRAKVSGSTRVGGIFGELLGSVSLTSVTNFATVSALSHTCGGLGGYANVDQLSISQSSNIGEVGCTNRAGGLVGRVKDNAALSVYRSANVASISASAGDAGGILGVLNAGGSGSVVMLESFNAGNVSGSNHAAGLIGNATDMAYQITRSYSVGLISGGTTSGLVGSDLAASGHISIAESYVGESAGQSTFNDGLVTAASSTVLVSVYTFANSSLTQSVTVADLKVASTYVDWNFDTVWGFGGCDLNNGYPVLRWANQGVTLYDYSCGVMSSSIPVVVPGSTPGNSPASNPAPVSYQGPMLESHQVTVVVNEVVVVRGLRLESILEASVGGKAAQINQLTSTSLVITIPDLEPGTFDLVVHGSHGVLTVSLKFKVIEPSNQVASSSAAIPFGDLLGFSWISKFDGNSRELTEQQVVLVSTALGVFANATTIVCWGYTKDPAPNDWALAHATKRAASLCNEVAALRDDVRVFVRLQLGVNRYAAMRATMQFWESKESQ